MLQSGSSSCYHYFLYRSCCMGMGPHLLGMLARMQERARWGAVLESLKLAPRQQEALLALRKQHLLRLASIYQDRQHLNMQVDLVQLIPTLHDRCGCIDVRTCTCVRACMRACVRASLDYWAAIVSDFLATWM